MPVDFEPGDRDSFRAACAEFATGVTAITARAPDGEIAALTANSFTSVSLDPPLILVCVGHRMSAFPALSRAERVAVHVLTAEQNELARRLATSGLDGAGRLAGIDWRPDRHGVPIIAGVAAMISGPIVEQIDAGDHKIFLIGAEAVEAAAELPALLFFRGEFSSVGRKLARSAR